MHKELNICITVFHINLPWIRRKTALESPATNPGGQATLKTSRTYRRKFQGNRELRTKNHITDDIALTAGSHSRAAISLSSSYQLCKQSITIHTLSTKPHTIQDKQSVNCLDRFSNHRTESRTDNGWTKRHTDITQLTVAFRNFGYPLKRALRIC